MMAIELDQRHQQCRGLHDLPLGRDRDVPNAVPECRPRAPGPELERPPLLDHDRKGGARTLRQEAAD